MDLGICILLKYNTLGGVIVDSQDKGTWDGESIILYSIKS